MVKDHSQMKVTDLKKRAYNTWYVLSKLSYMNRVIRDVLPTETKKIIHICLKEDQYYTGITRSRIKRGHDLFSGPFYDGGHEYFHLN